MPSLPDDPSIVLPAHGTTVAAEALHARLIAVADAESDEPVEIDGADVESIGQAMLQLLVAARNDALAAGREFRIVHPSPALVDRAARCRLADAIGLEAVNGDAS